MTTSAKRQFALRLLAGISFLGLIFFVRYHPMGRRGDLLDVKRNAADAIPIFLWMVATAAAFLVGSKDASNVKKSAIGCLTSVVAVIGILVVALAVGWPESWTQLESETCMRNLADAALTPGAIVVLVSFAMGVRKSRSATQ